MKRKSISKKMSLLAVGFLVMMLCFIASDIPALAVNPELSNWTKNLSEGTKEEESGNTDQNAEIAVAGQTVHVMWMTRVEYSTGELYYKRSVDGGQTWEPKKLLFSDAVNDIYWNKDKRMAVDGDNVHIIINHTEGAWFGRLTYIRSTDGGASFEEPVGLFDAPFAWNVSYIRIAAGNDKVVIGFLSHYGWKAGDSCLVLVSEDKGATFTQHNVYTTTQNFSINLIDLKKDGDNIYALYAEYYNQYHGPNLYFAASSDLGKTFTHNLISVQAAGGTHETSQLLGDHYIPKIAADGNNVYAAWAGLDGENVESVFFRTSHDNGKTFGAAANLSRSEAPSGKSLVPSQVTIAAKGDNVYAVFMLGSSSSCSKVYLKRSSDKGVSFFPLQEVTCGTDCAWWTLVQADPWDATGSKVHLAYNSPAYHYSSDAGANFSGTLLLSPVFSFMGVQRPQMAVGNDGAVHFVEESVCRGYDYDIFYRRYEPAPEPSAENMALRLVYDAAKMQYDNMQIPAFSDINFTNAMTAEVWIKPASGSRHEQRILFKENAASSLSMPKGYQIGTNDWQNARYANGGIKTTEGEYMIWGGDVIPDDEWTHLAITYDANAGENNFRLYVNGQISASKTVKGNLAPGNGILFVGSTYAAPQTDPSFNFTVDIDNLRLWNKALTPKEIVTNMAKSLKEDESGLAAYYNFNNTTKDITGRGHDGALMYKESFVSNIQPLSVSITGPGIITPGQEAVFTVRYINGLDVPAEDVIVVFDIPRRFSYVSSTENGIFRNDRDYYQVFWKLGTIEAGASGVLSVRLSVPWGLPSSEDSVYADIGARNDPSPAIDIDDYLSYSKREIQTRHDLSTEEIALLLSQTPEIKAMMDYMLQNKYISMNSADKTEFDDGSSLIRVFMWDTVNSVPAIIQSVGDIVLVEKVKGTEHTLFNLDGGMILDRENQVFESWGTWAEIQSSDRSSSRGFISSGASFAKCQALCMIEQIPSWGLGLIKGPVGAILSSIDCVKCNYFWWLSVEEAASPCSKCAAALAKIPGVEQAVDEAACNGSCAGDPNQYDCTEDIIECRRAENGTQTAYTTPCKLGIKGWWATPLPCGRDVTNDNIPIRCIHGCGCVDSVACESRKSNKQKKATVKVRTARDPNAKSADFSGNVIPGQTITYTIEYENVGAGTAYDVFILDELDTDLDEKSLVINNNGEYTAGAMLLSWEIGELPPCDQNNPTVCKGSVSFKINVKNGLPSGTEIMNYAVVHFPSAKEVTPTNPLLNIVRTIAADPKTAETVTEKPVSVILTGRDTGSGKLTFRLTSDPLYGTVVGTPPNITYTSVKNFSGQDEFYYVVNNGITESDPAKITVKIQPDPADTDPPTVISTFPGTGEKNIRAGNIQIDSGIYSPVIKAVYSEPLDSGTVTSATFKVDGISGTVFYDDLTKTSSFAPSVPLSYSTVYTARLGTGIKDKVGNALSSEYVWTFTTVSPANIEIVLPDNAQILDFGDISANTEKIISILSTGSQNLVMGNISITGENKDNFRIIENTCQGKTLQTDQNCTVKIAFEPKSSGGKTAILSVMSNDTDTPAMEVVLKGGILTGDINGDARLTLADALQVLKIIAGLYPAGLHYSADINADKKIGLSEAVYILQKVAGL